MKLPNDFVPDKDLEGTMEDLLKGSELDYNPTTIKNLLDLGEKLILRIFINSLALVGSVIVFTVFLRFLREETISFEGMAVISAMLFAAAYGLINIYFTDPEIKKDVVSRTIVVILLFFFTFELFTLIFPASEEELTITFHSMLEAALGLLILTLFYTFVTDLLFEKIIGRFWEY